MKKLLVKAAPEGKKKEKTGRKPFKSVPANGDRSIDSIGFINKKLFRPG